MNRIIKILLLGLGLLVLAGLFFAGMLRIKYRIIVNAEPQLMSNAARPVLPLVKDVNPFIGTGGYPWVCGHNFPGAALPFGMVRLSPETASVMTNRKALNTSGYFYGDNKISGFSHTRLSGTGATDGGHFLVVPSTRPVSHNNRGQRPYRRFSHRDEVAFPGYYALLLPDEKIFVELTATERVGIHRYTFPGGVEPYIFIDVSNALGDAVSREATVTILPDKQEVEGSVRTFGTFARRYGGVKVYFVARFDRAFKTFGIWNSEAFNPGQEWVEGEDIGVDLNFINNDSASVVGLQLAISYVSIQNARANLEAEAGSKQFDDLLALAQDAWEEKLSLIKIKGATNAQRTIFYTALYRVFQMPTVFNDVNGEYFGFDKQVHRADGFRYFTDLSLWDTFRTLHPLYNIIAPADQRDMMVSLVRMAKEGGWLPRWPSGNGYTGSMLGTPADITITDAWLKGICDFDVEFAYQSMRSTALGPTPRGAEFSGRRGIESYLKYNYCAADMMDEAVSKTLEYAWADHSIGQLAQALGKKEDAALFAEHALYYRNTWNQETQYFHPRNANGDFVEDFKPLLLTYLDLKERYTDDYVEGSALQWRWAVPFDAQGLISLFDSPEFFVSELNDFFAKSDPEMGNWNPGPYYWHGNEPDIHAAYLFNEAGRPDLTQKWVRWILDNKYDTSYKGLDGNDDGATLSAWYIFSSLGFYPIAGSDVYQIGAPLFREAEVKIGESILLIKADNYATENRYVQKIWLNDIILNRHWIRHSEIANGGVLRFEMTATPNKQ
ncbi:MAG: GH92 family glycosyl hydrolase [Bacteroidales bacterium]|nr:GH92 family glycosyl hydrolase [Bacteroidales bacterium]